MNAETRRAILRHGANRLLNEVAQKDDPVSQRRAALVRRLAGFIETAPDSATTYGKWSLLNAFVQDYCEQKRRAN